MKRAVEYFTVFHLSSSAKPLALLLFALLLTLSPQSVKAGYERPPHIDKESWRSAKNYFLPYDHPLRKKLDAIFHQHRRVLLSKESMKRAGFINPIPQKTTRIIVTKHPSLEGYIVKTHLDSQKARKNMPEQYYWIKRITGRNAIESLIEEKGWGDQFKVPKKWIYPLPAHPSPPTAFQRINYILVEEDMELLSSSENIGQWASESVDGEFLEKVFFILEELGLKDCAKPDNIPFSRDGKIAFIDTQSHHEWPVVHSKLSPFLSKPMRSFWKELSKKGRKG